MRRHPLIGLILLVSVGAVGAVVFTPALPTMMVHFGLSVTEGEFAVGVYLFGYAVGQLPYGPLANRYGARATLTGGTAVAIIGALCAALTYYWGGLGLLLVGLFVSAVGASCGLQFVFKFIPAYYKHEHSRRIASWIFASLAVAPYLAATIGGFLTQYLGWPTCFLFFALYILVVYVTSIITIKPRSTRAWDKLLIGKIITGYLTEFRSPQLVTAGLLWGFASAVVYVFTAHAPYIGIVQIGLTPSAYGLWALVPASGFLTGCLLSNYLSRRVSVPFLLYLGTMIITLGTLAMLIPFAIGIVTTVALFVPASGFYVGVAPITSNSSVTGLRYSSNRANAAALIGFLNRTVAFLCVLLIDILNPKHAVVLPSLLVIDAALLWGLSVAVARGSKRIFVK